MSGDFRRCAAVTLSLAVALSAQTTWQTHGGPARAAAGNAPVASLVPEKPQQLPAGDYAVHFPVGARGKPLSLSFAVAAGERVDVATRADGPAARRRVALDDEGWMPSRTKVDGAADQLEFRTIADDVGGNLRLEVAVARIEPDAGIGLCVRWTNVDSHYRCLWLPDQRTVTLERVLGGSRMTIASAAAPGPDDEEHRVALQAEGFRLQVWLDDALVLQALDGALTAGRFGPCWSGERPALTSLFVELPIANEASSAIVQSTNAARFHAAVTALPGHLHVLELALDRPGAPLPRTAGGLEPWLMQPPAAPAVLLGDWRNSLGANAIGEVSVDGLCRSELHWPALPALRQRVALVRALLVSADGDLIVGATPATRVVF